MALENPINIRLSREQQSRYATEAAKFGVPLATYLREQLEAKANLMEEISSLKQEVVSVIEFIDESKGRSGENGGSREINIMLEMLLLLRQIAQPQKVQFAQSELRRLGFTIWSSEGEE